MKKTYSRERLYPVPAVRSFHFQDGGDVTNPAGLSLYILPRKYKSGPMPPSWQTIGDKSQQIPCYAHICPRYGRW